MGVNTLRVRLDCAIADYERTESELRAEVCRLRQHLQAECQHPQYLLEHSKSSITHKQGVLCTCCGTWGAAHHWLRRRDYSKPSMDWYEINTLRLKLQGVS